MLACALAVTRPTRAEDEREEPSFADKETARSLFQDGDRKYRAGDFKGALAAFEAADEIMGVPTTGLERGRTLAQLGRLLEAREVLLRVTRYEAPDSDSEVFTRARHEAADLANEVAERIPALRIHITGLPEGADFELRVDGTDVPPKAARFPRKVDPGKHVIEVRAEDYRDVRRVVQVRERDSADVDIAMQPLSPGEPPSTAEPSPGPLGLPIMSWVGFSVGAAGLVLGVVAGSLTLVNVDKLDKKCPDGRDRCPPDVQDDIDEAEALSHAATAGFVIAGVGVAVGVAGLFIFGPIHTAEGAGLRPWVGFASAGLSGSF